MSFYEEITKSESEFNIDVCKEALRLKDDERREIERTLRERERQHGYNYEYKTEISDVVYSEMSFNMFPIKCRHAYNILHELGRGIYSGTINYLYRTNPEIYEQAILDGYKPDKYVLMDVILTKSDHEIRRMIIQYGISMNVITRRLTNCFYKLTDKEIERRENILRIILEEGNIIWYEKEDNPFTSAIISGFVGMAQMLLDHYGINNLRTNINNLIKLALMRNSIHSPIVEWLQIQFGLEIEGKYINTMLRWRKNKNGIIHSESDILEVLELSDRLDIEIFKTLIIWVTFSEDEIELKRRLFETIYSKIDSSLIDDDVLKMVIIHNGINKYRQKIDEYMLLFFLEYGYYERLMEVYNRYYNYIPDSDEPNYNDFSDYIRRHHIKFVLQ